MAFAPRIGVRCINQSVCNLFRNNQALASHFFRLWQAKYLQHCRSDVRQNAAVPQLAVFANNDKRYWVGGMCGERCAVRFAHLICITMVSGNQSNAALCQDGIYHSAHAGINGFYSLLCSIKDTRMTKFA